MKIKLTTKQAEYVKEAHHRWNFAIGAVRSGKSHLAVQYTIPDRIIGGKGQKGLNLILGATKENIERNVLSPMRDIWGSKMVSDINARNWATLFGEKTYCIGAENIGQVSKLRGSEIKFAYCDEICDIHAEVFEMLKSRLSLPYSECHAAANPASPTHYVKKFIDKAGADDIDLWCQHYTIYDNPFLPEEYVRGLEAEYRGTVYYDRYIKGLWSKAEGLIYPGYTDALEDEFSGRFRHAALSVDYGTQNAFAAILWLEDESGIWHAKDLYYYSGRAEGHQKTDDDYVKDLADFVSALIQKEPLETIVDPSASSFIAALRRHGGFKVRHADNDVANGVRDTAVSLQKGLVKVSRSLEPMMEEFAGYVWDDKEDEDRPVKENDHAMDALRYFVRTKRVYKPGVQYEPVLTLEGPRRIEL